MPLICFQTPALDSVKPNPMIHCIKPVGHRGPHSWEKP